jgi:ornithine decarboxylase
MFPRVEPLYAVKSNYDVNVLKLLAHFGIGFDCSSQDEIEKVLKLNIQPNRILFANPCKLISQIKFSKQNGINSFVFDNECELIKIKENHPNAECFIRMKVNCLPDKFGADFNTSIRLIQKAIEIDLKINGISFYVGFRQENANNIIEAIRTARLIYDHAREKFGYVMNCLDIGGGFPGKKQKNIFN